MNLQGLDLMQFLPLYMRNDESAIALAFAVENQIKKVASNIALAQIYANIGGQSDTVLDEIAWQFNVVEYSATLPIEAKRDLVKNCMKQHAIRGTKKAVENVINSAFGSGWVEEWFEYNGSPGHFKVHTTNAATTDQMVAEFDQAVSSTQNARSWLEAVIVELVAGMDLNFACYTHTAEFIYV